MKLSASFVLILASLTNITLGATLSGLMIPLAADDYNDDCPMLGAPMPKSNLPDGVFASDIRQYAGHPLDNKDMGVNVQSSCRTASPYGCSHSGYCWKVCGEEGEWCWTAADKGKGAWLKCSTWRECSATDSCGGKCSC